MRWHFTARVAEDEDVLPTFGGEAGEVTAEEMADAERLVAEKYANPSWTHEFE